jgi:hypothetical protein
MESQVVKRWRVQLERARKAERAVDVREKWVLLRVLDDGERDTMKAKNV